MQLDLYSFNGTAFSPNYTAFILYPKPLRQGAGANFLDVAGTFPQYTGKLFQGGTLTIQIRYEDTMANVHVREAEISRLFDTTDETPHKLVARDLSDGNRQWYCMATPLSVMQENNSAVIVLALDNPFWYVNTPSTDSWSISVSPSSHTLTCIGEKAEPIFTITPTTGKAVGYTYSRFVEVIPQSTTRSLPNYPINLGQMNTSALVSGGKALSSGNDFRVFVDGVEVPRWFGSGSTAFNTTTTNIWVVLSFNTLVNLTLKSNMGTGAITTIDFEDTDANRAAIRNLPTTGILKIKTGANTEYFTYTGVVNAGSVLQVTGVTRAAKLTTAISHTAGDSVTLVPYDIWIVYGKSTATAPVYSNNKMPMFDVGTSSNTSWAYLLFYQAGTARAGMWSSALLSSTLKTSAPYTATGWGDSDPATEAGLHMSNDNGDYFTIRSESATLAWTLNCPAGITAITCSGLKYRSTANFPTVALQKSSNGITYTNATTIATPTAAGAWQSFTVSALSLSGSYPFLRFLMTGTLSALMSNQANAEIGSLTGTVDSTHIPAIVIGSEINIYNLDLKITNTTTGEAILVNYTIKPNTSLIINCATRRVYLTDGTRVQAAIKLDSSRVDWLNLEYGTNSITIEDTGTPTLNISATWYDMVSV